MAREVQQRLQFNRISRRIWLGKKKKDKNVGHISKAVRNIEIHKNRDFSKSYYGLQRLCYIVFLEYLSKYLLNHYDTLPQFVSHPPLIFVSIVHYQRGMAK